eukprot:397941-Pyramimonas_sp.AAC.1
MPIAGRPISFSPGGAVQSWIALGDAGITGGDGPTLEQANPRADPGTRGPQSGERQRDALG